MRRDYKKIGSIFIAICLVIVMIFVFILAFAPLFGAKGQAASLSPQTAIDVSGEVQPVFYLDAVNGNDANNGTSESLAKKTLPNSLALVKTGGTLLIRNGTYGTPGDGFTSSSPNDIQGVISLSAYVGTPEKPIVYKAYPGEAPFLAGAGQKNTAGLLILTNCENVIVEGIHFRGGRKGSSTGSIDNSQYITIKDCIIEGGTMNAFDSNTMASNGLPINSSNYVNITNCTFDMAGGAVEANGGQTIYASGVHYCNFEGNLFKGAAHASLTIKENSGDLSSYNIMKDNVIDNQWGNGIATAGGTTYTLIEGNIIKRIGGLMMVYAKTGAQIAASENIIRNNIFMHSQAGRAEFMPKMMTDGNTSTAWRANCNPSPQPSPTPAPSDKGPNDPQSDDPQFGGVDLGPSPVTFDKVKLIWAPNGSDPDLGQASTKYYYEDYTIDTSNDGRTWTTVATKTGGTGGNETITLATAATAKYVRMNGTKRPAGVKINGCMIEEFEVYNGADPQNIALGKNAFSSSVAFKSDHPIDFRSYLLAGINQNCINNRTYNNVITQNGGPGIGVRCDNVTLNTDDKIFNNIVYANRVTSSGYNYSGKPGQYEIWAEVQPQVTSAPGSVWSSVLQGYNINNNIILSKDYFGDKPGNPALVYYDLVDWAKSLDQVQTEYSDVFANNIETNPMFTDENNDNFTLQSGSPAIDAGAHYAKTTASGNSTTFIPVDDPYVFCDGFGVLTGDTIWVGPAKTEVKITNVDYTGKVLTVDRPVTFASGDYIDFPYNGGAPDLGAFESAFTASSPTPTPTPEPTLTPTSTPTLTTTPTLTPTPIPTPTSTPTLTPEPTQTPEITPSPTPVVTETLTPTPTPEVTSTPVPSFTDISGHWAESYINTLAAMGIISGYETTSGTFEFRPDNPMQRQEFAKIITVAYNVFDPLAVTSFTDCNADAWYIPYVGSLVNEGLTTGMGNGTYGVGLKMTRQDTSTMLARAMVKYQFITLPELGAATTSLAVFADATAIGDYAKPAVAFFADAKIINGYAIVGGFEFRPQANITRAEISKIMLLALNYVPTPTPTPTPEVTPPPTPAPVG